MNIIFKTLPIKPNEYKSMEEFNLNTPFYTAALFIVAICAYHEDKDAAYEMIDMLRGAKKLNKQDKKFIRDRMSDKSKYIGRVYLQGAESENNYTPEPPYIVNVIENPYSYSQDGYAKLFISTKGADSSRPIELHKMGDEWFLWNYSSLLSDIRKPKSADIWK
ncbi:MAG: DUF6935 domain-containing protein [Eubacteriales bacterium]